MESSPLTLAHSHARNALLESRKSNPVAASEEHDLAAGEFATAAQNTSDKDALRTLHLLEQHHKRLAKIIRFQHENPPPASAPDPVSIVSSPAVPSTAAPNTPFKSAPSTAISSPQPVQQLPRLQTSIRSSGRETPSLASNLASARGIPPYSHRGTPVPPALSQQNGNSKVAESSSRMRNAGIRGPEGRSNNVTEWKPSWSPAISPTETPQKYTMATGTGRELASPLRSFPGDEPFRKFYSTFEGLISKLSAPLAFASLPLGAEDSVQRNLAAAKSGADTKVDRYSAAADLTQYSHKEPDVKKLVSSAALRAIRDKDGYFTSNASESFYVVPTSGGMISYAGILSRAEKEARRNSFDEEDDNFVDARENPPSPETRGSMTRSRDRNKFVVKRDGRSTPKASSSTATTAATAIRSNKTLEELEMENQALKHLSDTLAKRLHMWEVNAQSSSLALQQSLKAIQNQAAASSQASPSASMSRPRPAQQMLSPNPNQSTQAQAQAEEDKVKELEALVKNHEQELERVARENEKLKNVLGRYRERWEKLKEGARSRRDNGGGGGPSGGAGTATNGGRANGGGGPGGDLPSPSPALGSADMGQADRQGDAIQMPD